MGGQHHEVITAPLERSTMPRALTARNGVSIGDVLAETYELREHLAAEREYDLFGGYDRVLGRDVTLKVTSGTVACDHLRREARMLAPLAHPNLPAVYFYGVHEQVEFMVTESLRGTTLAAFRELRQARGGLATHEVIAILTGIVDALAVMHAAGYVHGRLTPNAVIITSDGRIVVHDPVIVGDVVPGGHSDPRTDLQALGFLAFELATGQTWRGEQAGDVPMPSELARIVGDLLHADRQQAPHDASMLAASLRALQRQAEHTAHRALTIVIADDDEFMRALLAAALRSVAPQAVVHQAADGIAAIDLVERYDPDLLLLDLEMPRLDGIGVCTYVRGTQARDRVAICVMSAHTDEKRATLARLGVVDAFQKGAVLPAALPEILGDLLRRLRLLPDTTDVANPLVGGRYQLGRQLGRGGMGLVYEARHVKLGRTLALKTISPTYALDAAARARFHQEARLASEIVHPNVVGVIDYGEDRHIGPYMVMELAQGTSLAELAATKLPLRRACDLLGQVADAVSQIHAKGVVHGDIKAENIVVVEEMVGTRRRRVAKLLDFGLARRITSMTATSDIITGTPLYISPERVTGAPPTVASDVYALGVLGYLLLTGAPPFDAKDPTQLMLQHVRTEPPPLAVSRGEPVDVALQTLISRALAKDLFKRHPSANAFRYELNNAIEMLEASRT